MTPPIIDFEAATSGLDHWQSQREELRRGLHHIASQRRNKLVHAS